jgi:mannose-6-phosphate isomerase-like protein (cupin superfamily)
MRKVNLNDIAEEERKSPKGKFHKFVKEISIALGREKESLDLAKRHPFDLAQVRIPKGKSYCPYHGHGAETELYLVVSGRGKVRNHHGTTEVREIPLSLHRAKRTNFPRPRMKISSTM